MYELTDELPAEMRRIAEAATPGEWKADGPAGNLDSSEDPPTAIALLDEVKRLRAALHLRDATPKPPENAAWHWSLISNSDYTKVCAENALLRALTTVDDAMLAAPPDPMGDGSRSTLSK